MTSTRCARLFETMDSQITNLEEIDEAELAAHKKVWEKRGRVIKSLEKAQGDLRYAVHKIIGSADDDKEDSE
jgi:hypothetical protein